MRTLDQFYQDLLHTTRLVEVAYSETSIRNVLDTFGAGFLTGSVQFKTTSRPAPRRGLYFRQETMGQQQHALDIARDANLLPNLDRPVDQLLHQVYATCPLQGFGIDAEVKYGLAKIWHFLGEDVPIDQFYRLPAIPTSLVAHAPLFAEHQLRVIRVLGADYQHDSMNIYFPTRHPLHHTPQFVKSLISSQGFALPSAEMIERCTDALSVAMTFNWRSQRIERMCFYTRARGRAAVPAGDPVLTRFAQEAPTLGHAPFFIMGWSFGIADTYVKIEGDYSGDLAEAVQHDLGH